MRINAIPGFRGHVITFTATMAVAVAFCVWLLALGHQLPTFHKSYTVRAVLPTAAALVPDARVTMAGAPVGHVTSVKRQGVGVVVEMKLTDDSVTPLPADSRVRLRVRTAVGENYISISPGHARASLSSDAILPIDQADAYTDVDQILSVFAGKTKQRARQLLRSLGGAVQGRGAALNDFVGGAAGTLHEAARVAQIAAEHRTEVADVVSQLGDLTAAVGERNASVQQIARQGVTALRAVADRDASLRRVIDALPSTLRSVRATTATLNDVTNTSTPVVSNLADAVHVLRPAVNALQPAADEARTVLASLSSAAPGLTETLSRARSLSAPTADALPSLRTTLCQLNPTLRFLAPYTDSVLGAVIGLGSSSNSYDALGHLIRLAPTVNDNSLVGLPKSVNDAAQTLLHTGFLSKVSGLTYNPYPKPGQVGRESAESLPQVKGPDELRAKTGYVFPHVQAEC